MPSTWQKIKGLVKKVEDPQQAALSSVFGVHVGGLMAEAIKNKDREKLEEAVNIYTMRNKWPIKF